MTLALHLTLHIHTIEMSTLNRGRMGKTHVACIFYNLHHLFNNARMHFLSKITPTLQKWHDLTHPVVHTYTFYISILINNSNSRGDIPPFKLVAKVNLRKTYMVYDFSISFFYPLYTTYFLGFFIKSVSQDIWRICEVSETWEWRMV